MNQSGNKRTGKVSAIFFAALAFNLVVAGVYAFIFIQIRQENVRIAELSNAILTQMARQDILQATKERVAETVAEREKLDHYFISKDSVVPFLNSLQSLGIENGLSVKLNMVDIEPSPVSEDTFEVVKISLEALGSWSDGYRFLSLIELMPLKVSVARADLQKNVGAEPSVNADKKSPSRSYPWRLTIDMAILKLK